MFSNASTSVVDSRYDIPVAGLGTPAFYVIHSMAITCILISLFSAIAVIFVSFRTKSAKTFFKSWSKCERFVVYLAFYDGLFNMVHFMDHFHMAVVKDHVHPIELCEYYGFIVFMFISAQMLLVSLIAINAFVLMKFSKNLDLGKYDWKLLLLTFGFPFVECLIVTVVGKIGPTGASCGVTGRIPTLFLTTVPVLIVITLNSVIYTLTWSKIRAETKRLEGSIGEKANSDRKSTQAAKTMSLFVLVFFIQWWAAALYGIWMMAAKTVPFAIFLLVTSFSNIGGILNGIVFLIMRKNKFRKSAPKPTVVCVSNTEATEVN
ncbi:uncharacterized protein LOC128178388 [Crassostrea angulata]|uniref:uncharacterized protein LOC128178388 n=1 Tax=Magallana angulata TaxID=2784310 RepID=UPI0022B0F2DA|nr:uncharacterized protein LOC128178388 [Crassostrea angulata]